MKRKEPDLKRSLAAVLLVFALFSALVTSAGHVYYQREFNSLCQEKYEDLAAIAQEKSRAVTTWLIARARDAARPARSPFFIRSLEEWLSKPEDPLLLASWKRRLRTDREDFGYDDVIILSPDGWSMLLSAKEDPDPVDPFTNEAARKSWNLKGPVLTEPYISPNGKIHLDAVCPVMDKNGRLLAFLVVRSHLGESLFPIVQSWPTPSPSAETLLVKREVNYVIFINELRHRHSTALSLGIPIDCKEIPSVQAASGKTGMFFGKDYRDVEVLADLRPVSGTSWFMVTKVDAKEIKEEARHRGWVAASFVGFSLLLFASLAGLWIRHGRARLWKRLYSSERELRLAQEGFRTTLYSIGDGVIATDHHANIQLMNPVAEALTGWDEAEARSLPLEEVFQIINEESRKRVENPAHRVLREGLVVGLANHTILISKDGTERPIADSGAPIRDEKGQVVGVVMVFRDQTQERALRRELERSRAEWQQIFQAIGHPSVILSPDLKILEANQAAIYMSGLPQEELLGKKCYEVFHATQQAPAHCPCVKLLEGVKERTVSLVEYTKQGKAFMVSCTPFLDEEGNPEKLIHVATDVTELKATQEALRVAQENFRSLVENASQGIVVVQDEKIRYANPKALSFFGATMDQVLEAHYLDFTHPEDRQLIAERYRRRAQGQWLEEKVQFKVISLSGEATWVEGHTTEISWDGKGAYLVYLQDLSQQKKIQEEREKIEAQFLQAQKMEAVGRLAGGVAHDFNNMLSVVTGFAELGLREAQGNKAMERCLREIMRAAERSTSLVRQLMAFARKQIISPKPLDINITISSMLKMLRRLIGEDIDLVWVPGQDVWTVYMDPTQLDQILANLAVNARDAISGTGKVTIETQNIELDETYCREHPGFTPGEYVMLAFTDDGCGMDAETLRNVFEPFFTTKGVEKGTGLGLSTVWGIVKQNNGFINVYSEPGKGTTFRIYLPRYRGAEQYQLLEPMHPDALPKGIETVLLVEDDPSLVRVYQKFLKTLGYKVLAASSPQEAMDLAAAHQEEIQLLLTDVVMPQMSGKELWEILKKEKPELRCLFMSGYTANSIAHHGVLQEGVNFIEKPFSLNKLALKLREVIEKG